MFVANALSPAQVLGVDDRRGAPDRDRDRPGADALAGHRPRGAERPARRPAHGLADRHPERHGGRRGRARARRPPRSPPPPPRQHAPRRRSPPEPRPGNRPASTRPRRWPSQPRSRRSPPTPPPRRRPHPPSGRARRHPRRCRRRPDGGRSDPASSAATAPRAELCCLPHDAPQAGARPGRPGPRRLRRRGRHRARPGPRRLSLPGRVLLGHRRPEEGHRTRAEGALAGRPRGDPGGRARRPRRRRPSRPPRGPTARDPTSTPTRCPEEMPMARSRSGTRGRRGPRKPPRRAGGPFVAGGVAVVDPARARRDRAAGARSPSRSSPSSSCVSPADIIRELIKSGIFATINQLIDRDTASLVAEELGYEVAEENASAADRRGGGQRAAGRGRQGGPALRGGRRTT